MSKVVAQDLVEYVRKRRRGQLQRVGLMLARKVKDKVYVGWSKCWVQKDVFNPEFGKVVAEDRIKKHISEEREPHPVPHSMNECMDRFLKRCKRYYKTKKVKVV